MLAASSSRVALAVRPVRPSLPAPLAACRRAARPSCASLLSPFAPVHAAVGLLRPAPRRAATRAMPSAAFVAAPRESSLGCSDANASRRQGGPPRGRVAARAPCRPQVYATTLPTGAWHSRRALSFGRSQRARAPRHEASCSKSTNANAVSQRSAWHRAAAGRGRVPRRGGRVLAEHPWPPTAAVYTGRAPGTKQHQQSREAVAPRGAAPRRYVPLTPVHAPAAGYDAPGAPRSRRVNTVRRNGAGWGFGLGSWAETRSA
eukprot:358192-Chlamydomonas_euryale.AAC.3